MEITELKKLNIACYESVYSSSFFKFLSQYVFVTDTYCLVECKLLYVQYDLYF